MVMKKDGIVLKKGKEAIFHNQHLWIFSGAIFSFPDFFENGGIYPVYSASGDQLGSAYFHKGKSLSGRILSFGSKDPWEAIYSHLDQAIALRTCFFDLKVTNAFRLVNGEGDFLPGLVLDQYGEYLILQSNSLGADRLKGKIVDFLLQKKKWKGIFEKSSSSSRKEEKLPDSIAVLWGEEVEELSILENRFSFYVNWKRGQKTGFFLDQREMRKKVGELSSGRRVLNCFSYSGGFSIYGWAGGAKSVDSIDSSSQAIEWAKRNALINGFTEKEGKFLQQDAFLFLSEDDLNYDFVVLDPPAFAKKKEDLPQAMKGYRELNYQVISKMPKRSLLLTSSCSYHVEESLFQTILFQAARMAKREVQIIGKHIPAIDHPTNLFHPESNYLKSILLYLS